MLLSFCYLAENKGSLFQRSGATSLIVQSYQMLMKKRQEFNGMPHLLNTIYFSLNLLFLQQY